MTRRIAIAATAFIAGLAIAGLSFPSSAAVCKQTIIGGLDQCKCPVDKLPILDVRQCLGDLELFTIHQIPDYESIIKEFLN